MKNSNQNLTPFQKAIPNHHAAIQELWADDPNSDMPKKIRDQVIQYFELMNSFYYYRNDGTEQFGDHHELNWLMIRLYKVANILEFGEE